MSAKFLCKICNNPVAKIIKLLNVIIVDYGFTSNAIKLTLLAKINVKFNVIGITETRLKKSSIRNTNIDLNGYSFEHTPTEANCGGALLYIDNNINYIVRYDLFIYRSKELQTVFTEF